MTNLSTTELVTLSLALTDRMTAIAKFEPHISPTKLPAFCEAAVLRAKVEKEISARRLAAGDPTFRGRAS